MRRAHRAALIAVAALAIGALAPGGVAAAQDPSPPPEVVPASEVAGFGVTPTTGLVDDQVVTVTATGLQPRQRVFVEQCLKHHGWLNCDEEVFASKRASATGRVTVTLRVAAVLTTIKGPVDCRSAAGRCVLNIYRQRVDGAIVQPLAFVPDAPLAEPPTISVSPATGLVDGQVVDVVGSGFHPDVTVALVECPPGLGSDGYCDGQYFRTRTDADGNFATRISVAALLASYPSDVDCRTVVCELAAQDRQDQDGDQTAVAPLSFVPDGPLRPPTSVTVEPATGLHGGQAVTVRGTGFRPLGRVLLLQCRLQPANELSCHLPQREEPVYADIGDDGSFEQTFVVHTRFRLIDRTERNCRNRPCSISVLNFEDYGLDPAAISFAPRA